MSTAKSTRISPEKSPSVIAGKHFYGVSEKTLLFVIIYGVSKCTFPLVILCGVNVNISPSTGI